MDVLDHTDDDARPATGVATRIRVDPDVQIAEVGGRLDLQVRGSVLDPAAVTEIALIVGDELVSRMSCGTATRHEPAGTGFAFILARARQGMATRTALAVEARLADGRAHREVLVLLYDPTTRKAAIEACPATAGVTGLPPDPPIRVYVESARRDAAGDIHAVGWVVARTRMATVQIHGGAGRIGAARLGLPRDDVGRVHAGYPDASHSGFAFTGRPADGRTVDRLVVQAFAAGEVQQEMIVAVDPPPAAPSLLAAAAAALAQPPGEVRVPQAVESGPAVNLHCDDATLTSSGLLTVTGWAVCAAGIGGVTIWLDDTALGEADLGLPRADVGQTFPTIPFARLAGFRFEAAVPEGEGQVRVVARSGLGRTEVATHAVRRLTAVPAVEAPPPPTDAGFRIELDTPRLVGGAAPEPIAGRLTIGGWAVAQSGIASIAVLIDGQPAGVAHHGIPRQDVAAALPDWPDALRSGYLFNCPPRLLKDGPHEATVRIVARSGDVALRRFAFTVRTPAEAETQSGIRQRMPRAEFDLWTDTLARMAWRPAFRVLLPLRDPGEAAAAALTLDALCRQPYADWQALLLAPDAATEAAAAVLVDPAARVRVIGRAMLDRPLDEDALYALLGPGDLPGVDALVEMALASGADRGAAVFTCDESRISPASGEREPFHKPRFSPDLLLHSNYVGRFWCVRGALLAQLGATPRALLERGEYDLVLRCAEAANGVRHVPRLLCHRGTVEEGARSERAALAAAAARRGIPAEVTAGRVPRSYRLRRTEPVGGLVSVVIPTCAANGYIRTCIETLRERTAPGQIEIVCIENIAAVDAHWKTWLRANADRVIGTDEAFNWSRFNNRCVAEASGAFLLFLNDDIEITDPEWLDTMLEELANPGVGIVGPQLLYADGRVQHAGMFLAKPGLARHAFRFAEPNAPGYFGLALTTRNVIAVTGACMLVRRSLFDALGGFDEAHDVINNDLDFCLRAHEAGHAIVFTPHTSLIHHEMASRGGLDDRFDAARFDGRWRDIFLRGDPFSSPNLARETDDLAPEEEPAQLVCAGHPLFARDEIARILVLKLDHIGDFFTAVPALRRLRALFPDARITMLASRGVRDFALGTGAIDAFIAFEFFHARSGLGQKELGEADFADLAARLAPERFDLAVDLRKHLDTREVLRHTGARLLAGFDHIGQFGWLDVALEWEGDRGMHAKRSHVSDDLLNLVEAIGTASTPDRAPAIVPDPSLDFLPADARAFFAGPVVCVHPGVGTVMRQWPAGHFARLVDLLVADHGVRVVLIGGPDEAALAEAILAEIADPASVRSMIGVVGLRDLPTLIGACTLFVGNNSGPKHIAAALGVPTIGIHSGVVDAAEWAPVGPRAVAIRRSMSCSPCYLARPQDCHRDIACLTGLEPAAVLAVCARFLARPC